MKTGNCLFAALIGLSLSFSPALAGSATWSQNPTNGDWNEPSNWVPATVPNGPADVATFGASNLTSVSISKNVNYEQVSAITFDIGASPFMITVVEPPEGQSFVLIISGTGIVNDSGIIQNFVSNSAFNGHGQFLFENNSTAGSSTVFTNNGASFETFDPFIAGTAFINSSSAGGGTFINNPGSAGAIPGYVSFEDNATAGNGGFVNNGATVSPGQFYNGGSTLFQGTTTAANATVTNNGGLANLTLGGSLGFYDNSTAGNATVTNNPGEVSGAGGGHTAFFNDANADHGIFTNKGGSFADQLGGYVQLRGNASAGDSTIMNDGATVGDAINGSTYFDENSTAANATLLANGGLNGGQGGKFRFAADSTGGTARVVLLGNGFLTISTHNAPGVTIGSLEGSGNVFLGSNNLTIGSRSNSTGFSGGIQDGGSLTKIGIGTLTLSGANTYTGLTTITAGNLAVDGSIMSAVTVNNGGALAGSGTTSSITVNSAGIVAPGDSQTLHINGNYAQNAGGVLKIEVAGADPTASGHLDITGSATLDGTLEVRFVSGFLPLSGQVFEPFNVAGALAGSFAQIIFPDLRAGFQFQAEFVDGTYQITALNDGVAATGFLNISTRMQVGTGDNALIGGFIVTGSTSKKVIIRAIGPSLSADGTPLPGRLADPTLELRNNTGGLIFSNDNWMDSPQAQEIIDSGIPPSDDLEAAIVATLAPGNYTAIMRGVNGTTGIGVVEVYDLAQEVSAKLANISSRGFVETGDNVMIGGLIAGNQAMHVMVRALGPSLTQFGIANALADPTLELHDGDGAIIAFNDDWRDTDEAAIEATGIPPSDDKESAILAMLAPGNYTAIVRGQNDTTGVALVEVYDLH
jgi:autotransporter-associated beta strand protein